MDAYKGLKPFAIKGITQFLNISNIKDRFVENQM